MPKKLGELLTEKRKLKGVKLRDVEAKTGVSNGYLSLLEQGKIGQPSPNILYKLAEFYGIEYAEILEAAGYASKGIARSKRQSEVALDRDIEDALKTCMEFHGIDVGDVEAIKNRVAMLRMPDDVIEWKIDGQLVMRFGRQGFKDGTFIYKLKIYKQNQKGHLIINTSGKLLTLKDDGRING